jgi:4-amino-4-deoxy-L-arabinose transferase-like glycosyltransferase
MSSASTNQLRELYRQSGRSEDLFPIFDRTRSFEPWIVVLALIPALYVFQHASLSESDSEWVLRSRDLLRAQTVEGVIGPGGVDSAPELRFQPPMGTWLSAALQAGLREFGGYEGMLLSWLGTGLLIFGCYRMTRMLFGGRIALWTTLLVSGQGLILWQAQTVLPISLSLLFALGAIGFLQDHLLRERGVVTWQVLGGGLCLGMCVLLGGPIAVLPVAVQLITCLGEIRADRRKSVSIIPPAKRVCSLLLMWAICLIASGWWPALMASAYGYEFWMYWWKGISDESSSRTFAESLIQYLKIIGPIIGLAVYGAQVSFRQAFQEQNRAARQLTLWLIGGGGLSIVTAWMFGTDSLPAIAALAFVSLILTICAAIAFDLISRGELGVVSAVFLTLAPLLAVSVYDLNRAVPVSQEIWTIRGLSVFCLFSLAGLHVVRNQASFGGRYLLPGTCLILIAVINYRVGLTSQPDINAFTALGQPLEADQIGQLHKVLRHLPEDLKRIEIISPRNRTSRFRLELALAFPEAKITQARNWAQVDSRLAESTNRELTAVIEWGTPQPRPRFPLGETWRHRYLGQPESIGEQDELRLSVLFSIEE